MSEQTVIPLPVDLVEQLLVIADRAATTPDERQTIEAVRAASGLTLVLVERMTLEQLGGSLGDQN